VRHAANEHPRHLYVHVPFCGRRCAYCDFSIAVRAAVPVDEYIEALTRELRLRFPAAGAAPDRASVGAERPVLDTLYFGGGTPSRLGPEGVRRALAAVRDRADLAARAEVTLEANPEDITPGAVAAWLEAGINRLSIGSQSFDDDVLRWMHRIHDADAIRSAVDSARQAGMSNYSLDLIFALPEALERDWERDVDAALALEPAHLSLYGLTVEPHTPLGRWSASGRVNEAPEERYEAEFLHAHDALIGAGLEHYEVSNFARPGLRSRHNSAYWSGVPYAAIGPSAHAFDGERRSWNASGYVDWLRRLADGLDPTEAGESLSDQNRAAEQVYLGLRTTHGLQLSPSEIAHVGPWLEQGWGAVDSCGRLVLSAAGWLRLDALAADLTVLRSR
jgi:oxygen-independent coproporphyrinogen-3 oxidase